MALKKNDKGLTLIELLITIAVIAIVAAISVPVITNVIDSSRTSSAASMEEQVNAFIEKYTESGEVSFDGTDEFTAWVDLDGDGVFSSPAEVIETFTVDTTQFAVTIAGTNEAPTGATVLAAGGNEPETPAAIVFPSFMAQTSSNNEYLSQYAYSIYLQTTFNNVDCSVQGDYTLEVQTKPTAGSTWTTDPYSDGAPLCNDTYGWPTYNTGNVRYGNDVIYSIANVGYDYIAAPGLLTPDTEYSIRLRLNSAGQSSEWLVIGPYRTADANANGGGK